MHNTPLHKKHIFLQWLTAIIIFILGFLTGILAFGNHDSSSQFQTNLFHQISQPQKLTPHVDLSKLKK